MKERAGRAVHRRDACATTSAVHTPDACATASAVHRRDACATTSWTVCVAVALAVLPGCKSTVEPQGHSRTAAAYSGGALSADLPSTVRVPAAIAAAESALRDRGYTIGARRATEDSGFVEAKLPRAGWLEKTKIRAGVSGGGTRVSVKVEPWGDEAQSRAILDDVLKRLGM